MDNLRLERLLIGIARKYAPSLVPVGWRQTGDYLRMTGKTLPEFASKLANYGAFVLFGGLPNHLAAQADIHLKDWAEQWMRLHMQFADALFPTFRVLEGYFLGGETPRALLVTASATPITYALAEVAAPFVSVMYGRAPLDSPALNGVVDLMLAHMESAHCARELRERLHLEAGALLGMLTGSQVRTVSPVPFEAERYQISPTDILSDSERLDTGSLETGSMSVSRRTAPQPPDSLPEEVPESPTGKMAAATPQTMAKTGPLRDVSEVKTGTLPMLPVMFEETQSKRTAPVPEPPRKKK